MKRLAALLLFATGPLLAQPSPEESRGAVKLPVLDS
jgi:hypothetical protein